MRKKRVAALLVGACIVAVNVAVLVGGRQEPLRAAPDCVLVLGAGLQADGSPSMVLRDRLDEALELYRSGRADRVLVSGDHRTAKYDEVNAMRRWLEERGVPSSRIFMDHAGLDTYSSLWRAKNVFGVSRVVIATQRFHLPRALWVARSLGMEAEGASADRRLYRGAVWLEMRELASRTKAFVDVAAARQPRHGGSCISLDGDGGVTAG